MTSGGEPGASMVCPLDSPARPVDTGEAGGVIVSMLLR